MWLKVFMILNLIISNSIIAEFVGDICIANENIPEGICTLISDCPQAIREIKSYRQHSFQRCGFEDREEIVCCPRTTENKFGQTETPRITKRISERECEKIKEDSVPRVGLYIIGGVEAEDGEFPHMVALGFDRGNGYEFDCGGTLISKNYVLTAAHCVNTLDEIQPSIVRAGVINIGDNSWNSETDYRIADIINHPKYTRIEKYHDLALLRLERDVRISSKLYPVCIETGEIPPRSPLTVTGWGKNSNTRNTRSEKLLKTDVIPVPSDKCSESYTNMRKLPQGIVNGQICAGDPEGKHDTCRGDSGGPLQLAASDNLYRLVGVTSFGRGCGSPIPGVYTRVSNYLDWIESVVWPN